MTFSEIKNLVGVAGNVIVKSDMRYSELNALVQKAKAMENGTITIIVESGTLSFAEISSLAVSGGHYVNFDLTKI